MFNPDQLATREQAATIADELNKAGIGGGVVETFVPEFFAGPAGFQVPGDDTKRLEWLHFKFATGAVCNVGLIAGRRRRYPTAWLYYQAQELAYLAEG